MFDGKYLMMLFGHSDYSLSSHSSCHHDNRGNRGSSSSSSSSGLLAFSDVQAGTGSTTGSAVSCSEGGGGGWCLRF